MVLEAFILIVFWVGGSIFEFPSFCNALELFTMVFLTKGVQRGPHDKDIRVGVNTKMLQAMLIRLTIIEIYICFSDTGGAVLLVHGLWNKVQLFTGGPGSRVDFGLDFFKRFTSMHEWRKIVLGVTQEMGI